MRSPPQLAGANINVLTLNKAFPRQFVIEKMLTNTDVDPAPLRASTCDTNCLNSPWQATINAIYFNAPCPLLSCGHELDQPGCFSVAYHLSKVVQEGQAASAKYCACCEKQPKL